MIPGNQPLSSIETEIARQRRAVDELDTQLSAANARLLEVGKELTAAYRELARIRVGSLAADPKVATAVTGDLDEAEARVSALLRAREETGAALAREVEAAEARRSELERERAAQAERLAAAAAAVDAAEARTQARLADDPGYGGQRQQAEEADRIADHAEEKADRSERELDEKGRAYRRDPLFWYLWRRKFGTPEYRAAPLFRWLDGKVARHAGFLEARPDYARLLEIPKRLREHATATRTRADEAVAALRALDETARQEDGIPALEAAEAAETKALAGLDEQLERSSQQIEGLLDRRKAFAAGKDDAFVEAIEVLAGGLRSDDLQELRREAVATPMPEDDAVVARLSHLVEEQHRLESGGTELNAALEQRRSRLKELEGLRTEYRKRQYDRPGHGFQDGALVASVLANVLSGMLTRDALWRVLEQQGRFKPPKTDISFGSGAFGRGSPWSGGGVRRSGGGGSRGGSMGGGGFRTGGGMRKGGFRTGGKF